MSIVRWEPLRDLLTAQDHFNRIFNDALGRAFQGQGDEDLGTSAWAPAVDIYETDHDLVMLAELPGIDPKVVEVRVEDNTLYLKGERKFENAPKEGSFHRTERSYGTFTRSFSLPRSADAEQVHADYKNGVLTLTLPKREEAKPKLIKINFSKN